MDNQEMQFDDPGRRPPQEGRMYADPGEQPRWKTPPPQEQRADVGSTSYAVPQAEKIGVGQYSQRPDRRRRSWLWLIVVLIALTLIGWIAAQFYRSAHMEQHGASISNPAPPKPVSFSVGIHPTIVINDLFGSIDVHAGSARTVTIKPTEQNAGAGVSPQINYHQSQDSDTITVAVKMATSEINTSCQFYGNCAASVNFDVTVPSKADLQLDTNSGGIDVTGISGQISLSSTTGTIIAMQDSLSGQSTLSSTTGTIIATQDSLSGQSTLSTTTSPIRFNGSIDPNGTYLFRSTSGSVEVTLPGNSSFHVDAMITSGSISCAFSQVSIQRFGLGANAHGDVGSLPRATVTLQSTDGSISLNKQ